MPKISYVERRFSPRVLAAITTANQIIREYQAEGYRLTLRQLYYQFVARDILPNTKRSYDSLGDWISDARLAGLVDWEAIEDRTRETAERTHWEGPAEIVSAAAESYHIDLWEGQDVRVEVWVEKEALAGVIGPVARRWDCPWLSCRGYVSQSEMWRASLRLAKREREGAQTVILHLGDHDPSGIDMTRDIQNRLSIFGVDPEVRRIALNFDQVEEYGPPPNPAKTTDARFESYRARYGTQSWELDALEPRVLDDLIERSIRDLVDVERFDERVQRREEERERLRDLADAVRDTIPEEE